MTTEAFHAQMARILFCKHPNDLRDSTPMSREAGTLDSMGETEIVYVCEDLLGVSVSFADIKDAGTYGNFLKKLIEKGAPRD